jgi:hypothetical protein
MAAAERIGRQIDQLRRRRRLRRLTIAVEEERGRCTRNMTDRSCRGRSFAHFDNAVVGAGVA